MALTCYGQKGTGVAIEWNPLLYERFSEHRSRPFGDLLARVGAADPRLVVDLGCGNGPLTLALGRRWPAARVIGVDSSAEMLARARGLDTGGRVEWVEADITAWPVDRYGSPDVVVSNAALQWIPAHRELIPAWCRALSDGGWLAVQVPGNFSAPSHRLIRAAVTAHPRSAELLPLLRSDPVGEPAEYADLVAPACGTVDVWETTYLQILDPEGRQSDPVLEWVRGTALRPVLGALTEGERGPFLADLAARLTAAYPRRAYGVPFPFRRIFVVGHRG